MTKLSAFAKAFAGRWRIVETDVWDKDFLDLVEIEIGDHHSRSLGSQPMGRCAADSSGTSGYDCHFIFQSAHFLESPSVLR